METDKAGAESMDIDAISDAERQMDCMGLAVPDVSSVAGENGTMETAKATDTSSKSKGKGNSKSKGKGKATAGPEEKDKALEGERIMKEALSGQSEFWTLAGRDLS
jgi:hypothetical protein